MVTVLLLVFRTSVSQDVWRSLLLDTTWTGIHPGQNLPWWATYWNLLYWQTVETIQAQSYVWCESFQEEDKFVSKMDKPVWYFDWKCQCYFIVLSINIFKLVCILITQIAQVTVLRSASHRGQADCLTKSTYLMRMEIWERKNPGEFLWQGRQSRYSLIRSLLWKNSECPIFTVHILTMDYLAPISLLIVLKFSMWYSMQILHL